MKKIVREVQKLAGKDWCVELTSGSHIRLTHRKTGKQCHTPSTPSDWRYWQNLRALLRRMERQQVN